jgi:hypothetical protein
MPNREVIVRIAKMLAGATSSEPAEASAKLHGAYKRMVRDSVTLSDLLSLPVSELYQDTLTKLVDLILDDQKDLSASGRREAYSQYLLMIVAKFSGAGEGGGQDTSRAEAAREYEERRQAEETRRGQRASSQAGDEKPFGTNHSHTPKQDYATPVEPSVRRYRFTVGGKQFEFSGQGFLSSIQVVFGRGSILWHTLHDPVRGMRLFGASLLFGAAVAGVMLTLAGVVHSLTNTKPLWDIQLKNAFAFLTACGFLWKARLMHLGGWFR